MKEFIESFFLYLNNETFESGAHYFDQLDSTLSLKTTFHSNNQVYTEDMFLTYNDEQKFIIFAGSFLEAKHIVEISYQYEQAKGLYAQASQAIKSIDNSIGIQVLAEYSDLQSAILDIDRGIYTGYAALMHKAAITLQNKTTSILSMLESTKEKNDRSYYSIIKKDLTPKVKGDLTYSKAIMTISNLYLSRWEENKSFDSQITIVANALNQLEDDGHERLASDLAPHIHVLKRFKEKRSNNGKLYVKNGEVVFYYYAVLDYRIREEFNEYLHNNIDEDSKNSVAISDILQGRKIYKDEMSDIWSGLASKKFIDTYILEIPSLKIDCFREIKELEGIVELKYYTMGIFEYNIKFKIDNTYVKKTEYGLSLTGLRHLQSLATPFALDEKISIKIDNKHKEFQFLSEFVEERFSNLEKKLSTILNKYEDVKLIPTYEASKEGSKHYKLLTHNCEQNRFCTVRTNNIIEVKKNNDKDDEVKRLTPHGLKKHFQHMALTMPVREVRTAIDNWIMYDNKYRAENFAGIRYNDSEWISVNPYSSVLSLLEQPVWVFDQAIESVEVAGAIINLINLSNQQLEEQLNQTDAEKESLVSIQDLDVLKKKKSGLESELQQLDAAKYHLDTLQKTVEAGSMMTYPDHTVFVESIFHTMQLEKYKSRTYILLDALKDKRAKSLEMVKKIDDRFLYSQQKMIKLIVSIISVFIALGSMSSLFEIWNSSSFIKEHGFLDTKGNIELGTVIVFAVLSTIWLLYSHFVIEKKKNV